MRGSLVHALSSGYGAKVWTPADLPADVLLYWSGGDLTSVAAATDGTGSVSGTDDTSLAAYLADRSTYGRPLVQATSGSRPIARAHPKGLGFSLDPISGRKLQAASSLTGGVSLYAAASFVGADATITTSLPLPFTAAPQSLVTTAGAVDAAHSFLIGLAGEALWVDPGTTYVNGTATANVGVQCVRREIEVHKASAATAGALILLSDHSATYPPSSRLHEVVILSGTATSEQKALVRAYMRRHRRTPVVALSVDSLSAGYNVAHRQGISWRLWDDRWGGCLSVANFGVTGQSIATAITGDPAKLDAVKGDGPNIAIFNGGANGIAGLSAAQVYDDAKAWKAMADARGWRVLLCSIPSGAYWTSIGRAAVVAAYRDLCAANWLADGFAGFIDLHSESIDQQGDGVHYAATGCQTVADLYGDAVEALI